jgi:mannose-6-phosphate isomerase-like protein (cupin superfamily)
MNQILKVELQKSLRKFEELDKIQGSEGTTIRQIFHPHNTFDGINHSLAHFVLEKGKQTLLHQMKTSETYYILEGDGQLHVDENVFDVSKNDAIFVPPMAKQFIENIGEADLKFLCIVDPPWTQDDEIILE